MKKIDFINKMNKLGRDSEPFIFIIDFECKNAIIEPLDKIDNEIIKYNFDGKSNEGEIKIPENREGYSVSKSESSKLISQPKHLNRRAPSEEVSEGSQNISYPKGENEDKYKAVISSKAAIAKVSVLFEKFPLSYHEYKKSFDIVMENIYEGNSYLCNLTAKTPIETNLSLDDIFLLSTAKYKIKYKNEFICFSPETFIKIIDGNIYSYPMKGTIDADLTNAKEIILNDEKEKAEHITIVDLIRNDLSIVSKNVEVTKFRYIDKIKTNNKNLLQVSSEIKGELPEDYKNKIGEIIFSLLPAGSITGAPKKKTVEIIKEAETYQRNFYTGIAGIFDGVNLDSCVMIRFIESEEGKLYFKSGGGITYQSDPEAEYKELIDKVYLPIYHKEK
jgi:para-aminobenzoate synthetase component 1